MATRNHKQPQQQQQKPAQEHLAKQVGAARSSKTNNDKPQETTTMTTTDNNLQMIPLSQLFRSALNVRKSGNGDVSELAASIEAQGLIQNLVVTPEQKGKREGMGVVAGGRRLDALMKLAKAGKLAADLAVPCRVVTKGEAIEISTAENIVREAMHPADEFEAYNAMVKAGKSADEVAARFGVTVKHVEQRMKMAKVSPKVIAAYRAGDIDLDAVMAFTLTDDHKRQERILKEGARNEWRIRRELMQETVGMDDRRAIFVGEAAYVAAGGVITGDMFSEQRYFHNIDLLDQLTDAKLQKKAAKLAKEFAWVEIESGADWQTRDRYTRDVPSIEIEPSAEVAAKLAALKAQLDALDKATDEADADSDVWEQYEETQTAIEALRDELRVPHPDAASMVGAVVMLTHSGTVETMRNVMRKSEADKLRRGAKAVSTEAGAPMQEGDPNAVRIDLSAHATAVAQVQMSNNVPVALRVLACQLAASLLFRGWNSGVEITAKNGLAGHRQAVEGTEVGAQLDAIEQHWSELLPDSEAELMPWCMKADDATINALLAYVTARTVNGVQVFATSEKSAAPFLAAMNVKMADHWKPTAEYFARLRKPATLAILAEHGHTDAELPKLKRDALAARAASLLQGTGWLPPTLR